MGRRLALLPHCLAMSAVLGWSEGCGGFGRVYDPTCQTLPPESLELVVFEGTTRKSSQESIAPDRNAAGERYPAVTKKTRAQSLLFPCEELTWTILIPIKAL
jgi:hypothetical protein